jgi:hypothetical protein
MVWEWRLDCCNLRATSSKIWSLEYGECCDIKAISRGTDIESKWSANPCDVIRSVCAASRCPSYAKSPLCNVKFGTSHDITNILGMFMRYLRIGYHLSTEPETWCRTATLMKR